MSFKLKSQPMFSPSRLSVRFTLVALVALSVLLLCSVAFAQTSVSNGSIFGTVTDATGAVVPNAKVTMTGPTGQTVHATTSGAGTYSSGALIPGAYSVRAEAKGFKTMYFPSLNQLQEHDGSELFGNRTDAIHRVLGRRFIALYVGEAITLAPDEFRS